MLLSQGELVGSGCVSRAPDVAAEPSLLLILLLLLLLLIQLSTRNHNFTLTCRQPPGGSRPPAGADTQGGDTEPVLIGTTWREKAMEGGWVGAGQGGGDAPSPCLADQGLGESGSQARSGSGWCSQGQAGGETAPPPKHPHSTAMSNICPVWTSQNIDGTLARTSKEHQQRQNTSKRT